ncbi:MAG: radical SAM protein [bacterium]|nr:radical SAM protein [bacterium]
MAELIQLEVNLEVKKIANKIRQTFPSDCQRILLIEPPNVPEEDWNPGVAKDNRYPVYEPYGLGIISSCIELRGYTTDIIDLNFMIQDNFKSDPNNFRYNAWEEWLKRKLNEFRPDVVGVTCMFTIYHRSMVRIARLVKECNPNIVVVAGGVHTTMASAEIKSSPGQLVLEDCKEIDFVCLNEGNDSFGHFLDIANNKIGTENITQIATLIDGRYTAITKRAEPKTETLNIAPNFHDLLIEKYSSIGRIGTFYWLFPPGTRAGTVLINRGCRAHCRFCSVDEFNGRGIVLKRDIDIVLDELERKRDKYGISHVMMLDDDLLNGEKRTIALFEGWTKRKLNITWDASNGVIASALTEEIAHAAAESGCIALSFGIESGNPEVLRNIPKPSGVKHYLRAGEIMKKYPKIFTKGLLMVGFPPEPERNFPGESIKMIWDTINVAKQMDLDWYTIQPLNFIPGVDMTNHALAQGTITKQELLDGSERPVVGSTGKQDRRSGEEKAKALPFINHLCGENLDRIPKRSELIDIWFVMDYMVNYEKLWKLEDPIKINMLHKLFVNMCDKTHKENALGNLFFALLEFKLKNTEQADYRLGLARKYATGNDYWRKRFPILGLDKLIEELQNKINLN